MIQIYDINNAELIQVNPADSTYRNKVIMSENILMLYFSLTEAVEIPIGAYVMYKGERYTLYSQENFTMTHTRKYDYTLMLETEEAFLKSTKLKYFVIVDGLPQRPFSLKFVLVLTPSEWIQLIVNNLNLTEPGWSVGDCLDAEARQIAFNHEYCDGALNRIAEEYNTEYEIVNKTISLKKVEKFKDNPLPLAYGKQNGLKSGITRTKESEKLPVGILYVQGGEKNIDFSKYHSRTLLLPKSQSLVYEGRTYITDADGTMITCVDLPENKNEDSYDASSISPQRVGSVTQVIAVDAEAHFYDIIDSTIPQSLDFSQMRIAGEKAVLIFQSGSLSGYSFDIQQTEENLDGYVHAERRFKLVPLDQDGMILPSGGMIPEVGDTYAIFNIALPDAYVCDNVTKTGASWDMFREAVRYKYENEIPRSIYKGELDEIYAKSNWLAIGGKIVPGGYVLFSHPQFLPDGQKIRIVGVKEFINKPYSPKIELSNVVSGGSVKNDIAKIDASEVVNDSLHKQSLQFTKRRFRDAQETMTLLSQSLLNFSGSVSPITVQTMALLVGDESLQFRFVSSKVVPVVANHVIAFSNATKVLSAAAGILQHMTVGIKTISQSHLASEYRYWDMAAYDSPPLTEADASKAYYLYAKCAIPGTTGVFVLSDVAIGMTSVAGYYHFLVGILNSENASERSYVSLYGFSEILPGRITTDKIISPDGRLSIDLSSNPPKITALDGAIIEGKVQFQAGSSGLAQLTEWPTAAQDIQDAAAAAAEAERKAVEAQEKLANDIDPKLAKMQEQIDGEVSGYYFPYSPTLTNYPASEWLTTIQKEAHLGDTFNNNLQFISNIETPDAGKSWRWTKSGTDYFWNQISDSDSVLALKKAAEAKGVADGKSTHYLIQPTAYKFGDSWVCDIVGDAEKGSMLFATQDSNVFNRAHWVKKDKYTDDTAVNNLQIGGRNLIKNSNTDVTIPATQSEFFFWLPLSEPLIIGKTYIISCSKREGSYQPPILSEGVYNYDNAVYPQFDVPFVATQASKSIRCYHDGGTGIEGRVSRPKLEVGSKATDWTPAPEDVDADITAAQTSANNAQSSANTANTAVASLNTYVDGSFKDGVISEAEAQAIEKYTNSVNASKLQIQSAYTQLYANAYLEGTAKTNLASAKTALDTAITNLLASITAAIADGQTTPTEKADVDAKFASYNSALSTYQTRVEEANKAIQDKLKTYSDAASMTATEAKNYIDNTLPAELSSLQAQIDGQVESWDFPYVPTLSNYPASEWTTDALKDRHIHDTFYNNQPFVDNTTTPDAGKAWRFTKSGGTYFWNPISDSDAVKALALAAQAQDTADGKRRVFVTQPTTPYEVGDLWTQGTAGDIMRCINARLSGAYVAGDWEKAVKYTDDTAVNNLQIGGRNLIKNSNTDVTIPATQSEFFFWLPLSEPLIIGKTYIISCSKREGSYQPPILSEGVYNYDNAVYPQFDVPFVATQASKSIRCYHDGGTGIEGRVSRPKLEVGSKATDWTPAPEDVDATAEAYALAKAALAETTAKAYADGIVTEEEARAIADATAKANAAQAAAIAAAALDATAKVGAIQVGGRNILPISYLTNTIEKAGNKFKASLWGQILLQSSDVIKLFKPSTSYIISGYVTLTSGSSLPVYHNLVAFALYDGPRWIGMIDYGYDHAVGTRVKITKTFATPSDLSGLSIIAYTLRYDNGSYAELGTVLFEDIKIEVGNKATDWTPALEDVQAEIDAAKAKALELEYLKTALAGTTEVAGGLILARMMMLKNALNQVTAGISGMDSNDIFLFANDTDALNAALNNMATFLLRRNGTGNLGTLKFTRNGLAYCTRNADGTLGKAIIEFRNTPIPPLSDLVASFTDTKAAPGGNATKMGGVLTGNFGYGVPIIVSAYDNFSMRVTGTLEASINNVGDMPILDSHAAINLVLYKYDGGVYTVEQNVASLYLLRDVTGTDSDSIAVDETYTLAKGTYYLRAEYYINTSEGSHDSGFVSAANLQMVASGASGNQTMIFGSNGFVRVKDGNNFTYMSDEMMAHRGVSDMPGVLASGTVDSQGTQTKVFGAKSSGLAITWGANGIATIPHAISHSDYQIHITVAADGYTARPITKGTQSIDIKIVNSSGVAVTGVGFEYTIYGRN